MNVRFFRTVACYTLATAGLALAMLLPGTLNADNPAARPRPIATPTLHANGVDLSAHLTASTQPSVEMVVQNTTDKPADAGWTLQLTDTSPFLRESRIMPRAQTLWTKSGTTTLQAGEKRTLVFDTNVTPPAGTNVGLTLNSGSNGILALPVAQAPTTQASLLN